MATGSHPGPLAPGWSIILFDRAPFLSLERLPPTHRRRPAPQAELASV
ncbi:hypothetical protein F7P83_06175 [Brevibacterium luteolum]|nr:hypothetical protein [Brevibacterium luteolum]